MESKTEVWLLIEVAKAEASLLERGFDVSSLDRLKVLAAEIEEKANESPEVGASLGEIEAVIDRWSI